MNKKTFLLATICSATLLMGAVCVVAQKQPLTLMTQGSTYALNLNRSLTAEEVSAKQATFNTSNGNAIVFKFDSASTSGGLVSLAAGGYFYNDTPITGITKIEATLSSGGATLHYGNEKGSLYNGSQVLSGTSVVVNFAAPSDYFRIDEVTGSFAITNLSVTYSCSNNYQYEHDKEAANGDLFSSSTLEQSFSWAYVVDRECLEVANADSGLSFHMTINSGATGWPVWKFNLGSPIGTTNYDIVFYAKGIGHQVYNVMLLDASDDNILNANYQINLTESWQKIVLSGLTVASGKSLADVQKVKMSADYSGTAGSERHLYLDELHVLMPETPTRNNLEMVEYTRPSNNQTAVASFDFEETYGSSTASRKLDYAGVPGFTASETGTYRAFATFNVEGSLGSTNGIDVKNCMLTLDLKYSDVLVNAADTRNNQFTLDITDCGGSSATAYVSFTVSDGWMHISKDLSGVTNISNLANGNLRSLRFGFYGVYTGNQADAVIHIDNLAITAK